MSFSSEFDEFDRMRRAVEDMNRIQDFYNRSGLSEDMLRQANKFKELSSLGDRYPAIFDLQFDKSIQEMLQFEEMIQEKLQFDRWIQERLQCEKTLHDSLFGGTFRQIDELCDYLKLLDQFRVHQRHRKVVKVLARRGWTGLERHFSERDFDKVLKLRESRRPKLIDEFICTQLMKSGQRKLNSIGRDFNKVSYLYTHRSKIKQAIRHHKTRDYASSITVLLPLIDGLAAHIGRSAFGLSRKRMRVTEVAKQFHASEDSVWSECIKHVVCELMYEKSDFDSPRRRRIINRHLTLHGHANHYDTEANSLRVILLLDTFAHIAFITGVA